MLRCRNKREKVEKCGRVPVFPLNDENQFTLYTKANWFLS